MTNYRPGGRGSVLDLKCTILSPPSLRYYPASYKIGTESLVVYNYSPNDEFPCLYGTRRFVLCVCVEKQRSKQAARATYVAMKKLSQTVKSLLQEGYSSISADIKKIKKREILKNLLCKINKDITSTEMFHQWTNIYRIFIFFSRSDLFHINVLNSEYH